MSYADGAPALVERTFKGPRTGRVLLWTTPLSRNWRRNAADAWNEFPVEGWSFLVLTNLTVPYMAGATSEPLTFEAGETVTLDLEPTVRYKSFSLTGPGQEDKPTPHPAAGEPRFARGPRAAAAAGPVDGQGDSPKETGRACWDSASTPPTARAISR